jgi:flagellar hook-associated protein 1 FlgK
MSGIFNIGVRSLQANQAALQTTGNNIANVNTPGYSRQSVVVQTVQGQYTGGGYIGAGVDISTVQRQHSEFLTRQAALSSSVSASDTERLAQLKQLEDVFQGGKAGLGSAISDMMNAFSDVANAPTDLSARAVVLTRVDEATARIRTAESRLTDLRRGVGSELASAVASVNLLAVRIAKVNQEIARTKGSGQASNDLLDQRDQLIKDLNGYVQTSSVAADDGTVSVFVAGSQPLVLGTNVRPVSLGTDTFGDPSKAKLTLKLGSSSTVLEEATLGGGKLAGLLRFQNSDLQDAGQLLGRLALAIGTAVNAQHRLGLDLKGAAGGDLIQMGPIPDGRTVAIAVQTVPSSGASALQASDYQIYFTGSSAGSVTRLSDGLVTDFSTTPIKIDGLDLTIAGTAAQGDSFLLKPFSAVAATIATAFTSPGALAISSPVAARAGSSNLGTLALASLTARSMPAPTTAVTLTFTAPGTYTRSDTGATTYAYTAGQAIEYNPATSTASATGWSLTLKGTALAGDTFVVGSNASIQPNADPKLNAGNALSLMALRDAALFDGSALTDGYAGLMAQVGVMVQGASYAADVSQSIAKNIEQDRAGVSGVNLDEEAAKLLQYQQAYQASAKMLQIAQGVFDSLLQSLGR